MKTKSILCIVISVFLLSCQDSAKPEMSEMVKYEKPRDGIFIHVSSGYDKPHKASMAINLGVKMMNSKDIALFFDNEGVNLLTKTSNDIQMNDDMTFQSALDSLINNDVYVMACPMCMTRLNIKPEDLRQGVIIADGEKFFNFTKGRILSLDY